MRWPALRRSVLSLLLALPIGYALLYPQIWRCQLIAQSDGFVRLAGTRSPVYVSRQTPAAQRLRLREQIEQANQRIRQFWGEQRGRAILIYCPTQALYERYCVGGEGAGCSLGLPWGASYLVLGPEGNTVDVVAHELCHDELFARLGWLTVKRQIPQWFNEGLALQLDYRFTTPTSDSLLRHENYRDQWLARTHGEQIGLDLHELASTRDFFWGDYYRVMLAYTRAGLEVSRWLAYVGRPGLVQLTDAVANGAEFATTYAQVEQRAKRRLRAHPPLRSASERSEPTDKPSQ